MKKSVLNLLIILVFLGCEHKVENQIRSDNFELIKLDEGVYGCIHKFGGKAICNSGIVDNGTETIIFDTFLSPAVTNELIEIVKKLKLSPIKYVINSHGHNDHIRGNQSFDPGVKIIATKKTAEKIKKEEPKSILAEKKYAKVQFDNLNSQIKNYIGDTTSREYIVMKMMKPYFEELSTSYKTIKTRLPNILIENQQKISGKKRDVVLLELDSCHTISDLIMYLPKEKILFSGDVIFNEFHPYLGDGNSSKLKNNLIELKKLEINKIVPGHGDIGKKELLSIMINYIEDLEKVVEQLIEKKGDLKDLKREKMLAKYQDWWLGNFYSMNIEYLYNKTLNQ